MKLTINNIAGIFVIIISSAALLIAMTGNKSMPLQSQPMPSALRENPRTVTQFNELKKQIEDLQKSLQQTHEQLVQLQTRQLKLEDYTRKQVSASSESVIHGDAFESPPASPSDATANVEALNRSDQHLSYLEDILYEQELDPAWSSQMSNQINEALSAIPGNLADASYVQCQATLCMVELTVSSEEVDDFILQFNTQIADASQQMRSFVHNRGDGKLTMQMYLAKAGYDLPNYAPAQQAP
ncbi:hypothetical protein P886_0903 [Alteromonadaceae bacterium 2753L.S.0a.02]|nr:hypothetical protein P886_0903 [Alteromonadaceae bacterium 2753L.S.0a.02]